MKYNISYLISLLIIYLFQINNVNAFQEASTPKVVIDSGVDSLFIYINLKDLKCIYSNKPAKYEVVFARAY